MIYFTKISTGDVSLLQPEDAIRYFSLKRHALLDFHSSSSNIKEDKYFLANENKNSLSLTRIRTSLEWFLPKIILSVDKNSNFETYRIRLCLLSSFIFAVLLFTTCNSLYNAIQENYLDSDIYELSIMLLTFILLTFIEIKLTKRKLIKAVTAFTGQ